MTSEGSRTVYDSESEISDSETSSLQIHSRTPLPKFQLFVAFLIQLAEPITATVIYPFIAQFVWRTGITGGDERKTGYFAGMIESVFFMAECVTVLLWGRASDKWGRRPILLIGPLGLTLAMIGFGSSTTFWPLVWWRFVQGACNGNIGVSKSVMAELSDSTNMAEVFGLIPLMWSLGSTLGPIIGGIFSEPDRQWPGSFGKIELLQTHPYLLPCLVSGSLAFIFFLFALVGLKETHPSYRKSVPVQNVPDYGSTCPPKQPPSDYDSLSTPSISSLLRMRSVAVPLGCFGLLLFTETSYLVLIPLTYSTSILNGGLGLSSFHIGTIMGIWGVYNVIWQGLVVSRVVRRFGPKKVHILGYACHAIGFTMFIVLNAVARVRGVDWVVYALIVVQFMGCNSMIYMSFATGHMFIVDGAPTKGALAVTNGLGQAAGTIARTVAPVLATSLFSLSVQYKTVFLGGYGVFVVMLGVVVVGIRVSMMLPAELRRGH